MQKENLDNSKLNRNYNNRLSRSSSKKTCEYKFEKPMISVLMTVYNTKENWLRYSIESILNQTYENFEFIIVTDCPTDGSDDIVDEYAKKDSRIKLIKNNENLGITKSLNIGMDASSGLFIARMDSDDISVNNRLERQLQFMLNNEDVSIVGSRIVKFNHDMFTIGSTKWRNNAQEAKVSLIFGNTGIAHPTAFIRKSFLDTNNVSYNEKYIKSQDYGLWIDTVSSGGTIYEMDDILLYYRSSPTQISTMNRDEQSYYKDMIMIDYLKSLYTPSKSDILIHKDLVNRKYQYNRRDYINYLTKLKRNINSFDPRLLNIEILSLWLKFALKSKDLKLIVNIFTLKSILNPGVLRLLINQQLRKLIYNKQVKKFIKTNNIPIYME